jgi:hypothetical protein
MPFDFDTTVCHFVKKFIYIWGCRTEQVSFDFFLTAASACNANKKMLFSGQEKQALHHLHT